MDYEEILNYIEDIVEEIDFEETSISEIKSRLQELATRIEDNRGMRSIGVEGFNFD
tara:strand:- start:347 stop:514 length:168 start_codon:yes stop_codon:yes gene_type:complete